ncbi:plasmid mobilization relaxosome protein MobC [Ruegeria hyattellae]|uniref:plasmid mobilization relaxosome protein MobC n=1 Tax=Ruegeria hyattellae TaxID=3233337 RepID=UPI00355BCB79
MPSGVPKSVTTTVRFYEDELALLKERRKAMQLRSLASLIRVGLRVALRLPNLEEKRLLRIQEQVVQLRGMAGNLNQMAKAANAGKFRLNRRTEELLVEMDEEIHELRKVLENYIEDTRTRSFTWALDIERRAEKQRAHRESPKVRMLLETRK